VTMMPGRIAATLPAKAIECSRESPGLDDRSSLPGAITRGPYQGWSISMRRLTAPAWPAMAGQAGTPASGQEAYFITRSPTWGRAASTCLAALPRTVP
jgi:hypothetical protein